MATLTLQDVRISRRDFDVVADLVVDRPVAIVGPSGAGKSTILRAVAGLDRPGSGRIGVGDTHWFVAGAIDVPPERRSVGFLFQDYALFEHMSVADNVAFGGRRRAGEWMERLGIQHVAAEHPRRLSGGERQRVALARALAREPEVLLLDEPTGALDAASADRVRAELNDVVRGIQIPTLIVTHDFEEAAMLARVVVVLGRGRIHQVGAPAQLVGAPGDEFVARLTGHGILSVNDDPGSRGCLGAIAAAHDVRPLDLLDGRTVVAVHPSAVRLGHDAGSGWISLRSRVTSVVPRGDRVLVGAGGLVADVEGPQVARFDLGDEVTLAFAARSAHVVRAMGDDVLAPAESDDLAGAAN